MQKPLATLYVFGPKRWTPAHLAQSQAKKVGIIKKLIAACQGNEAKFIVRSLEGKLRIGLADKTLVVALAHAIVLRDFGKFIERVIRFVACLHCSGDKKVRHEVLAKALEEGSEAVKSIYR